MESNESKYICTSCVYMSTWNHKNVLSVSVRKDNNSKHTLSPTKYSNNTMERVMDGLVLKFVFSQAV